jgi:CrcB protein
VSGVVDVLLVALGGGVGAAARFVVADTIRARRPSGFPWGTWWVNVLGSLVVGIVAGILLFSGGPDAEHWRLLLATGLCGGFTTFSTASVEAVAMLRGGRLGAALTYALGTLAVTVTAVAAGVWLAEQVVGRG